MEKVETEEDSLEFEDLCFENSNHKPQVFVSQIHIYLYTFGYRFGQPILMRTTKSYKLTNLANPVETRTSCGKSEDYQREFLSLRTNSDFYQKTLAEMKGIIVREVSRKGLWNIRVELIMTSIVDEGSTFSSLPIDVLFFICSLEMELLGDFLPLTFYFGCERGKQRSVATAELLAKEDWKKFIGKKYTPNVQLNFLVCHRDYHIPAPNVAPKGTKVARKKNIRSNRDKKHQS